jgi:ATP-binding cassette subfamily B protein
MVTGYIRLRPLGDPGDHEGIDRETVRRAWGLARPWRWRLLGFVVLVVAGSALGAVTPQLVRLVLDRALPEGDGDLLLLLAGAMALVAVVQAGLSLVQRYLSSSIGEGFILQLRAQLYEHVLRMPLAFFTRTQTGALITRLNNDVIGAQRALTGTLGGIVDNAISVSVTVTAMAILDWRVTLLAVSLLPLFIIPSRIVGRRLQQLSRESMRLNAEMNTTMTERFNVAGALLVKLFGRVDDEHQLFHDRAERVADIGVRTAMHGRVLFAALGLVGSVATALVYLVGGRLTISGELEAGTIVALALYVSQLYAPLAQLSNARVDLMTALVSFERVFEVTDLPHAISDHDGSDVLRNAEGEVGFHDVRFRYPAAAGTSIASLETVTSTHGGDASEVILDGIDLNVPAGTMLAVVGPSGAGKSTLLSLVPRLYDVTDGAVTVDGHDVRDLTLHSLRDAIGFVTQDPHLFHVSVADNLRYARADATDEELRDACRAARILDVIEALPDGFDTIVGERGYRMSGGEKQRLAIARVLLKDPAIVILDEATAHLDTASERLVQQALADVLRDRTSLVIAHRLSTVVDADEIIVVEAGEIVERGTHDELLRADGLYAELAAEQLVTG